MAKFSSFDWRKVGHSFRVTLQLCLLFIVAVVLFLVFSIGAFFLVPEIEISSSRLQRLLATFGSGALEVQWRDAVLRIRKVSALTKDIHFEVEGLCVNYKADAVRTCFGHFEWGLRFTVAGFRPRILSYAPLIARDGEVDGDLRRLRTADEEKVPVWRERRRISRDDVFDFLRGRFLPKWKVSGSLIEIRSLDLQTMRRRFRGAILLETAETFHASVLSREADEIKTRMIRPGPGTELLRLTVFNLTFDGESQLDGQMHVIWPRRLLGSWNVLLDAAASLGEGRRLRIGADGRIHDWDNMDFDFRAIARGFPVVRELRVRGGYDGERTAGLVSAEIAGGRTRLKTLDFARATDCEFQINFEDHEGGLKCGPRSLRVGLHERGRFRNRALFRLAPTFDLQLRNASFARGFETDWNLSMALEHLRIFRVALDASGGFVRTRATDVERSRVEYSVNGDLTGRIIQFARLVRFLRSTPFAIPAPLNQMRGPVTFSASADISEAGGNMPFELQTRLHSEFQKLNLTSAGLMSLSSSGSGPLEPRIQVDLALEQIQLSVPRFDLRSPPRLLPDSRFQKDLARQPPNLARRRKTQRELPFDFLLRVATTGQGRARLATNLTSQPIPVDIRYSVRSARQPQPSTRSVNGAVRTAIARNGEVEPRPPRTRSAGTIVFGKAPIDVSETKLKAIRRDAMLNSFRIDFEPDGDKKIDGRFTIRYPEYVIDIFMLGTVAEPVLRFESTPPLDEEQIIAVLIFGKPFEQLETEDQSSVAQLNTALSEAVLGASSLASMYLLANTPVESISYDPERGTVSARLGLAAGTSLEIGGSARGPEVGVRRRLARNLFLNTYVEGSQTTDDQIVSAFIEWVRRF